MEALSYEYLLRRIYQVERHGKKGVDADEYRDLEYAERAYTLDLQNIKNKKPRISTEPIDNLAYDYRVQCRKIWRFVSEAIGVGITKYGHQFSELEVLELKNCIKEPEQITKEYIDMVIKKAETIFVAHKVFP